MLEAKIAANRVGGEGRQEPDIQPGSDGGAGIPGQVQDHGSSSDNIVHSRLQETRGRVQSLVVTFQAELEWDQRHS